MRAKHLLGEKMNKNQSAAIPGMAELGTDQYFGTYKWSKEVAGHNGKKQTAPKGDGDTFKDAPVVGGLSKTERNMAKKAAGGKVTAITSDGSKESKDIHKDSPISGAQVKEARMSTAVKLQRAWERQQAKSAASRRRGEELLNPPKKEEPKKTTEGSFHNPGQEDSPVANALTRRILLQRTDLLAKYGPEKVGQAIDEVADFVGDVDEIGSSDVSGWVRHVEQMLSNMQEGVAEGLADTQQKIVDTINKLENRLKHAKSDEQWDRISARIERLQAGLNRSKKGVAEAAGNIGRAIKSLYQKIYNAGDDEIEYFYHDSPIFAQYWDEYEGDLVSIINDVDPKELQVIHDELESYVQNANLAEGEKSPMFKDAQKADRIRSLKNLIAIAREQGRQLRVQELELELKKLQGVSEGYGKYYCSTDKRWKERKGPKQTRTHEAANASQQAAIAINKKKIKEFAPDDSGDSGEEDTLRKYAKMWYNGDLATQQKVEQALAKAGWEIGELESEEGGAFVMRVGDEHGDSYIGFEATDLTEARKANTASARRELGKRTKKPTLSPQEQELKKKDSDESWARLMAYMDDAKKKQGVAEMDKSGPQPGRDGHVSHKTYGTRDRDEVGGPERTGKPMTAKQMMDRAHKAMMKSMSNAEKVDKGWRNPNKGVAEDSLNEFAPGNGSESGRWYTDDQMTDIVGDGWWNDLDVSGDIPKQQMIQEAQSWLDDQGYSVQVLNCKLNDDDMEWFIEGSFHNSRFAKKGMAESKMSEADAILRQIAEDEDWDLLYKIHGMAGRPTPEGMAGNIIDDMYQDVAIDSGHHADDDFEEIYNTVLDRIIEQYGIEESVQVNEVDPRNFDSDIDYYNALNRPTRSRSYSEPEERPDPYAEFEREQERRRAKAAKTEPTMVYSKDEGTAPNGKRYNMTVKFTSPDKFRADFAADRWVDSEWGAKKLVDKEQHEHQGETTVTIYVQDNHKHGMWKPWKDEEPIAKPISFEATNEDLGYKFKTSPKMMPRDTLGTDMSYHWGHGGGNKYGIDSRLGPREDPRFGKRDDGKQGYRPEFQKPSEYDHGTDKPQRTHANELHKLLSKHGQLNSKLRRLEKSNIAGSKDSAIRSLQRQIDEIERSINDMGGSEFLRHYTESLQQSLALNKLEETFVAKFANKYKGK